MRLIKPVSKQEMLRRWAIGEVYVDLLDTQDDEVIWKERLCLLRSRQLEKQLAGITMTLKTHHLSLVECIPEDARWYLAALKISKQEFDMLRTLPVPDLAKVTNNTLKIPYGAKLISEKNDLNPRIAQIMQSLRKEKRKVEFSGITLLAKRLDGPYTIIEGNGRLIGLYQVIFNERKRTYNNIELKVILGLSKKDI